MKSETKGHIGCSWWEKGGKGSGKWHIAAHALGMDKTYSVDLETHDEKEVLRKAKDLMIQAMQDIFSEI
jgi:hypothetical protein